MHSVYGCAAYAECCIHHLKLSVVHVDRIEQFFLIRVHMQDAVNFPERCALLVERHCSALQDFTGERPPAIALDIGCAVGGSTFHLAKAGFGNVLGMDYSSAFISAANQLKSDGSATYRTVIEGDITV